MLRAIIFKEWLKIRWVFLGLLVVNLLVIANIYINISNLLKDYSANMIWIKLIFNEALFYDDITYLPLLSGILIGVFQFFPEINQKRLKLTFHLPVKESRMLLNMVLVGLISLLLIYLADIITLGLISIHFFPYELFISMSATIFPWMLAGAAGYFLMAMVFIEPNWSKRVILTAAGVGLIFLFYAGDGYAKYECSWWIFALITILFSIVIYISAYNFKRGIS